MGKTFWGVVIYAVEQSRLKTNLVAQGDGTFGPCHEADPRIPKKGLYHEDFQYNIWKLEKNVLQQNKACLKVKYTT